MMRWLALAILIGCSHPAAKPEPTQLGSATDTVGSGTDTSGSATESGTATPENATRSGDPTNTDRVNVKAVDARIVGSSVSGEKLKLTIALPANETELPLKPGWAGAFTKDAKPLPGTDFKVTSVKGKTAIGELAKGALPDDKLPSETVRLYEAGNRSMLTGG